MLKNITFGELKGRLKNVEHEGFMVFDAQTGEMLFKLKSPYYLISKFLGRSNEGNIDRKLDKRHVDEEFYPLIDYIHEHQEAFNAMPELDKIAFIQAFFETVVRPSENIWSNTYLFSALVRFDFADFRRIAAACVVAQIQPNIDQCPSSRGGNHVLPHT